MPYYRFSKDDIFYNQIETHPKSVFYIYSGSIFYNNMPTRRGTHPHNIKNSDVPMVPSGFISLYEMNVDRNLGHHTWDYALSPAENEAAGNRKAIIHPFATKAGGLHTFKTMTAGALNKLSYGDTLTASFAYPLSASIQREYYRRDPSSYANRKKPLNTRIPVHDDPDPDATLRNNRFVNHQENHSGKPGKPAVMQSVPVIYSHIDALRNTLDSYIHLSPHYAYEFGDYGITKSTQELNLISIPSIFYGSSIRKGSVDLKFYVSGTLIAQCIDKKKNGELIEVTGSQTGSVAGVVLYNEGFVILTGSWDLTGRNDENTTDPKAPRIPGTNEAAYPRSPHTEQYDPIRNGIRRPRWVYFGTGIERPGQGADVDTGYGIFATGSLDNFHLPSSSFSLEFEGTNKIPVMTLLAHAPIGELNHSNNPTYIKAHGGFMYHSRARTMLDVIYQAFKKASDDDTATEIETGIYDVLDGKTITFTDGAGNTYSATVDKTVWGSNSTATKIGVKNHWSQWHVGHPGRRSRAFTNSIAQSITQAINYGVTSDVKNTPDGSAYLRVKFLDEAYMTVAGWSSRPTKIDLVQLDAGAAGNNTPGGTLIDETRIVNGTEYYFIDFQNRNRQHATKVGDLGRNVGFTGGDTSSPVKSSGSLWPVDSGSTSYVQSKEYPIKNTVSSSYANHTASFKKQTFISKIGIYDREKNLIGIAKLANPIKKTEERDFTFKLKLDF